ncbi:MAG: LysM peptidoglycan-binding domain-containing protein [Bacteroidota bacterium]
MLIDNNIRILNKINKFFVTIILTVTFLFQITNSIVLAENPPAFKTTHKVSIGESLSIISRKYKCTIEDIKKWNELSDDVIHPGQILQLTPLKKSECKTIAHSYYIVKKGDCLSTIAQKQKCSVEDLKKWNNLKSIKLNLGQKLIISSIKVQNEDNDIIKIETPATNKTQDTLKFTNYESSEDITIDSIISFAHKFIGRPYHSKMENFIFDCSGYVSFLFSKFGITLPRSSPAQAILGEKVDIKDLKKGDLVFFAGHRRNKHVGHVGMVISSDGNDFTMIHSSTHRGIIIENFRGNPYFEKRYITARRVSLQK